MQTNFYLMRHAEADYTSPANWETKGWGFDLAPLSQAGISQAKFAAKHIKAIRPEILICSPTTRTMQTAMLVLQEVHTPFAVEFDLHEWVPDAGFGWSGLQDVQRIEQNFEAKGGVHSVPVRENWESLEMMKQRMQSTLNKYRTYQRVLVVTHSLAIRSITGQLQIEHAEIVEHKIGTRR